MVSRREVLAAVGAGGAGGALFLYDAAGSDSEPEGNVQATNTTETSTPTSTPAETPTATETATATETETETSTETETETPEPGYGESDFRAELEADGLAVDSFGTNESGRVLTYRVNATTQANLSREMNVISDSWLKLQANASDVGEGLYVEQTAKGRTTIDGVEVLEGTPLRRYRIRAEWADAYLDGHLTDAEYAARVNGTVTQAEAPDYADWIDADTSMVESGGEYSFSIDVENDGDAEVSFEYGTTIEFDDPNPDDDRHTDGFAPGEGDGSATLAAGESMSINFSYAVEFFEEDLRGAVPNGADFVVWDVELT